VLLYFKYNIDIKRREKWYDMFKTLYNDEFEKYKYSLTLKLDMESMYKYNITLQEVASKIEAKYSDIHCAWSPENVGEIDAYIDTDKIKVPENISGLIDEHASILTYMQEIVYPMLKKTKLHGIPGVKAVYFVKDGENWMIESSGTNFVKMLSIAEVDKKRLITNNPWDIYETLGIEATRQYLIEQFTEVLKDINPCHIQLLTDRMIYKGTISSISRYTMRNSESGPIGKCSFEESFDNIIKSGLYGEFEPVSGVSSNIMCGNIAKIGSGMMSLKIDIDKFMER
jgi:DNA-directed RNA polymerase subunit A'